MKKYVHELRDGQKIRVEKDLKKLLNLNHLKYTNKTICCGEMDFPEIICELHEYPDYIALYNQPGDYHRTDRTCVGFYNFDNEIDGKDGLYNAIKYDDKKRLDFFKKRFEGVKYFMMPDYSIFGDVQAYVNYNRMGMAREVSIWLTMENGSIVIPNLAAGSTRDFKYMYDGYEKVKVAGISTKSKLTNKTNRALLQATIDEAVNRMPSLETFIVYDVSADNKAVDCLFENAVSHGIKIIIPDNILKIRNRIEKVRRDAR